MNQILSTKKIKNNKYKQFNVIFFISIFAILIIISINIYFFIKINNEENYSNQISKNYEVYKLYAEYNAIQKDSDIIGNIIIPKINVNYTIFSNINTELLRISPCRFNGEMPPIISNLCIAGHNYNDHRFFSNISNLNNNDLIIIENIKQMKFKYYVYEKKEINENNLNSTINYNVENLELTLITCNNFNNKRIVIKAKTESPL